MGEQQLGNLAFLFPGQGAQAVGMLADAHAAFPEIGTTFQEASDALGYDVWDLVVSGPAEQLSLTEKTQPIILTASVALYRAWCANGGARPSVVAGHSLGEFSALVAAESLAFDDAVKLVRQRGQAMQLAVPVGVGAMAAILGVPDEDVVAVCTRISDGAAHHVSAVNFNSPGQVVIAGHAAAVEEAIAALKEAGAKRAMPLPVSAPFHTPLMRPAGEVLEQALSEIAVDDPIVPVVSNVNAELQTDGTVIKRLLVEQIASPVLWTQCVQTMLDQGCDRFIECGPGKVLSGLVKRVSKAVSVASIEAPDALKGAIE
ncbi:malonyl CoA-acyl carrier protein transacylase [Luminiphilus syltensis NOR5-1B]|uniref:Malonyl CoA-acyl carrier protein transacylase n=1 Tax=Luminiphilus syltensis NOR5-1B TaxID=565045 RepID=B8KQW0_9GAMM|nr:ACP S-malonyltransferase [Luminiphilus syltensis]EED35755.1 malonyl CoA-acyl carrier protein transacylase [Luminiphilus syltensis NOR5-1B]